MKNISQDKFLNINVPVPPKSLQDEFEKISRAIWDKIWDVQNIAQQDFEKLFNSILSRAFTGELTAAWREAHAEQLREEAVQRDIVLELRGAEPTINDLKVGRVTRAEQEEANRQLSEALEQFRSVPSSMFQGLFTETFGDLARLDASSLLGSNAEALQAMQTDMGDLLATQMDSVSGRLAEQLSSMTQSLLKLQGDTLGQPMLQPSPELARQLAGWFSNIGRLSAVAELLNARKPLRSALTDDLAELLSKIAAAPAYFRPEALADDQVSLLQVEERLRLLVVLGLVRPITVRGQTCYRIVSREHEYAVPAGLEL